MSFQARRGRVLTRFLPVLVWLLAVGCVVSLFSYRKSRFACVGIAGSQTCVFTAPDSGWLVSLPVHLYQQVHRGQLLAVLRMTSAGEAEHLRAEMEAEKAAALADLAYRKMQAEQMIRQLAGEQSRERMEQLYRDHQLALDVERGRLLVLEIQSRMETAKIQLKDLEMEKQVLGELLAKQAIEPYELQKVQVQAEALSVQIAQDEQQLQQAQESLKAAQGRLEAFRTSLDFPADSFFSLEPLQKAIALQEKRLEELKPPTLDVPLEAPFDGIVISIGCLAGQTFSKDMPLLTLVSPSVEYITAWLDPSSCHFVKPHQPVEVIKTSSPPKVLRSEIAEVGPAVELMPERLWKNPSVPEWGRPIRIPVHPDMQLIPNELVGIRGI
jgi:multidrug resistance efflux pump